MEQFADVDTLAAFNPRGGDEALRVRFYLHPLQNKKQSTEQGRPIFEDVEFVEIRAPGNRDTIQRPATPNDKARFAKHYAIFKSGNAAAASGTPLAEWPAVSRSQVEELAYFGCHTVEQLAGITDANAQNIGPIQALKQKARDYLEKAKGEAPGLKMRAELEKRDSEIATLKEQLAGLSRLLEEKTQPTEKHARR